MAEYILEHQQDFKIGGVGEIVEVDESKFGKRKYNTGKRVVGKWILGKYWEFHLATSHWHYSPV